MTPLIVSVAVTASGPLDRAWRACALGLATGFVYFGGTLYWVVEVMRQYGGLAAPVAVPIGTLLVAYLALYVALFAILVRQAVRRFGASGIWLAPLFWVATEWLRSTVGGGFPWVRLGASQASAPAVVQLASLTGIYGLSGLVALVSTAAAAAAVGRGRRQRLGIVAVVIVVVSVTAWGARRVARGDLLRAGRPLQVGLVQGSIEQDQKYDPRFSGDIMTRYLALSRQAIAGGAQLVIWPEASTPFYFDANSLLAAPVRRLAAESKTPFLLGTDEYEAPTTGHPERFYNAAVLIGPDGRSRGSYRKMHLVPFGEYVPLQSLLFFAKPLVEAVSDYSPGLTPVVFDVDGGRVSVAICYESVYQSIAEAFVEHGSQLLSTITNDAWFGRSSAAYQHFDQGAVRAVEQGRYVVRAANTGISGAIDPYGHVLARTALFQPVAITVGVRLLTYRYDLQPHGRPRRLAGARRERGIPRDQPPVALRPPDRDLTRVARYDIDAPFEIRIPR